MKDIVKNKKITFTRDHYGKWVALSADRKAIIDYSASLSALTRKFGTKEVVYTKPQDPELHYAF